MRLSKLVIPMLYVGAAAASGATCSNGFAGYEAGGVCCELGCGSCGGSGCGDRNGRDCCTSTVMDSNVMCSTVTEAPCILDNGKTTPSTPTTPTTPVDTSAVCSNGFAGYEAGGVCCELGCGSCGGPGCGDRNGRDCCTSTVMDSNVMCSTVSAAPCIVDNGKTTPSTPTTPTTPVDTNAVCSNGYAGYEAGGVCCELGCGSCGGSGCGDRNGRNCCTSYIKDSNVMCSTVSAAPCIVDNGKTTPSTPTTPTTPVDTNAVCSNGYAGYEAGGVCCELGCGSCGGSGCGDRNGRNCCTSYIKDSNVMCSTVTEAPCIVDNGGKTTPTPPASSSYKYLGCFADTKAGRVFGSYTDDEKMTTAKCAAKCAGSDFFGTQYGIECWCSSDSKDDYDAHGPSTACTHPCGGASGETCGGDYAMSVYQYSSSSPSTPSDGSCAGGVLKGNICCSAGCGECGGVGCAKWPGLTGDDCCHSAIKASGRVCSATGAPCVVDGVVDGSTPPTTPVTGPTTPSDEPFTCSGEYGIPKSGVCCMAACGGCGGSGCASFGNGLGADNCCTGEIAASAPDCSVSKAAPCVIDDASGAGADPITPGSGSPIPVTNVPSTPVPSGCSRLATIEFKSSGIVLSGGGCATLTDIYNAQSGTGSLSVLSSATSSSGGSGSPTGYWFLTDSIFVYDDVTLFVESKSNGGDCDVLRMESTSSKHWEIRAHGGNLYFHGTKVTSWNNGKERTYTGNKNDERSFIRCITEFDDSDKYSCDGHSTKDMGTCRMDIIDSTMGNLGFFDAESYGLTWKVRGLCTKSKKLENVDMFETRNVYGDIKNSDIYGMYYGMYSYGHQGGVWTNNKMHDNVEYGFDPHDDSDYLTIAGNEVYRNGNHGIIASKRCNNVKIYDNHVYDGDTVGIMLHRSSDHAKVYNNYIHDNGDAGIAFFETYDSEIYDNKVERCKFGIRLSLGAGDNKIYDNTFTDLEKYGLYTYKGTDDEEDERSEDNKGRPFDNVFERNTVEDVTIGVQVKESDGIVFKNNKFINVKEFEFPDSNDVVWSSDNDIGNACVEGDSADFTSKSPIPEC